LVPNLLRPARLRAPPLGQASLIEIAENTKLRPLVGAFQAKGENG
jgi:hypothetical protein